MNILIKLTCLVGLVIAPILGDGHGESKEELSAVINVEYIDEDGSISSNVEKIVGTREEIDNKINEVKDQAEKLKKMLKLI